MISMERNVSNRKLTFAELQQMVDSTKSVEKLPTAKALLIGDSTIVVSKTMVDGSRLSVFKNGFALFQTSRFYTVIRVDQCGDYTYHSRTGPLCFSAEYFSDKHWTLRLQLEAESNIVKNRRNSARKRVVVRFINADYERVEDWNSSDMSDAMMEVEATQKLLEGLTEKQYIVIEKHVLQGFTLTEIGKMLGISKQGAAKIYAQAIKKMSKNLKRNQK